MAEQSLTAADGTFPFPACPSAPKDFKVAEVSRHHVHLMWEAPDHDGGSPVTHYQIEKREVSRKTWVKVHVKFCSPASSGSQCELWSTVQVIVLVDLICYLLCKAPTESSKNWKVHMMLERLYQIQI